MDLTCKTDGCTKEVRCMICMRCSTHHTGTHRAGSDEEIKVAMVMTTMLPLLALVMTLGELAEFTRSEEHTSELQSH